MALQAVAAVRVAIMAVRKRQLIVNHELDYRKNKDRRNVYKKKRSFCFSPEPDQMSETQRRSSAVLLDIIWSP
jgi:hypothetical protein